MRYQFTPPPPQRRETIREWDRRAIEEFGVPGIVLMENAGSGAASRIADFLAREEGGGREPVCILCGPGNNGGDGLVIARHLHNRRTAVECVLTFDPAAPLKESDATTNLRIVERMGIPLHYAEGEIPLADLRGRPGLLVDALFGTGLARPLRSPYLELVDNINGLGVPVAAVDIPSGLDADTGEVLGAAVRARWTLTFAAPKVGFYLTAGPEYTGTVEVIDIGIPRALYESGAG